MAGATESGCRMTRVDLLARVEAVREALADVERWRRIALDELDALEKVVKLSADE